MSYPDKVEDATNSCEEFCNWGEGGGNECPEAKSEPSIGRFTQFVMRKNKRSDQDQNFVTSTLFF